MSERWKEALEIAVRLGHVPREAAREALGKIGRDSGPITPALVGWWLDLPVDLVEAFLGLARAMPADPTPGDLERAVTEGGRWFSRTLKVDSQLPIDGDVPRRLGPYELQEEIGRGGMGHVHRARHVELKSECAVKVLVLDAARGSNALERFRREASALARIGKHPHIVSVHDFGQVDGFAYYAMELVEGPSLRQVLKDRPPSTREAVRLLEKVARALDVAHGCGLVHRDVKPENILIGADGEPLITDFGLARQVDASAWLTSTGQLLGTPHYMAPEQARGVVGGIDARTDVYALGAILYEVLVGRFAHPGRSFAEIVGSILQGHVERPREVRSGVDRDLEAICLKSLALEPADRYGSAAALAEDLARWLARRPVEARPLPSPLRWARAIGRSPWRWAAAAALAVTVVVIASTRWVSEEDPPEQPPAAGATPSPPPVPPSGPGPKPADPLPEVPGPVQEWRYESPVELASEDWRPEGIWHADGGGTRFKSTGRGLYHWSGILTGESSIEVSVAPYVQWGAIGIQLTDETSGRVWWLVLGGRPFEQDTAFDDDRSILEDYRLSLLVDEPLISDPRSAGQIYQTIRATLRQAELGLEQEGRPLGSIALSPDVRLRVALVSYPAWDKEDLIVASWRTVRIVTRR